MLEPNRVATSNDSVSQECRVLTRLGAGKPFPLFRSFSLNLVCQTISWIPLDTVAASVVELRNSSAEVLHLVHPRPVSWHSIITHISDVLHAPLVTYEDWVNRLGDQLKYLTKEDLENTPALKLLDAFREVKLDLDAETEAILPKVSMTVALSESPALANVQELSSESADSWIGYWTRLGLL